MEYTVTWSSFSDSAWKTAQSSGALNHLDLKTSRDFSDVYSQQDFVTTNSLRIYENQLRAPSAVFISGDPNEMTPAEIEVCLQRSADLMVDLSGLEQLLSQLDRQYTEELKKL